MTVKQKIDKIHSEEYCDFKGIRMIKNGVIHGLLRLKIGDEKYLEYLEERKRTNPRPSYKDYKSLNHEI